MSRPIISTLLIIIAVITFFTFIDPTYKEVKALNIENNQFDQALNRSKELQAIRDKLLSRYNTFSTGDLDRIDKLLPDNVDNVRLILDLDGIASKYGMLVREVVIVKGNEDSGDAVNTGIRIGKIELSFKITAPYEDFKKFVRDLEQSLRIVDIKSLSFKPRAENRDLMDFNIVITTYWLK